MKTLSNPAADLLNRVYSGEATAKSKDKECPIVLSVLKLIEAEGASAAAASSRQAAAPSPPILERGVQDGWGCFLTKIFPPIEKTPSYPPKCRKTWSRGNMGEGGGGKRRNALSSVQKPFPFPNKLASSNISVKKEQTFYIFG